VDKSHSDATIAAWVRLIRAGARALASIESDLKAAGLPPLAWYDVLLELKQAGEGLRPYELERRLLLAQHNVSRLLDRMESKKLVIRLPCDDDGRGQILAITDEGRATQKAMWPIYRDSIRAHVGSRLSEAEAVKLAALLKRLQ
jgi:DNA-binding MarR family transcriptional regulator